MQNLAAVSSKANCWAVAAALAAVLVPFHVAAQSTPPEKPSFEVASIRESRLGGVPYSNFPLNPGPHYNSEGGLLTARNLPFMQYLVFGYAKNMYQIQVLRSQLPDWARSTSYDIQARVDGSPTKDDMRVMMRSLLEDRFALKVRTEARDVPVFGLVLAKPGKLGPQLRVHTSDEAPCDKVPPPYNRARGEENTPIAAVAGGFPAYCGTVVLMPGGTAGRTRVGGRNLTLGDLCLARRHRSARAPRRGQVRPNRNLRHGSRICPRSPDPAQAGEGVDGGSVMATALKEQLGLKLEPGRAFGEVLVLDHIQKPAAN